MEKIKVLIADDSVVYRTQIRSVLEGVPSVDVVGTASNGNIALERIAQLKPDLLILDLEMPELDGIATIREIKRRDLKCKILVFSSVSKRGSEITLEALTLGASDFITKPDGNSDGSSMESPTEKIRALLIPKILPFLPEHKLVPAALQDKREAIFPKLIWDIFRPSIVVIGSSTGGPTVLERIFAEVNGPVSCPIVIAQHMPPIFTTTFAERLGRISGLTAMEARHGDVLQDNCIYVAPGDFHLRLKGSVQRAEISLDQGPKLNSVRPAVDPLFASAAEIYKSGCLAFVLTGMGADGKIGATAVKQSGGAVVIQSEESCVVFGMPGAVYAAGSYDHIANPEEIIKMVNEKISLGFRLHKSAVMRGGNRV